MDLEHTILEYFSVRQDVMCVYLFGSAAAGRQRPGSDVDIAVLLSSEVPAQDYTDRALCFMDDLSRRLNRNVDIVILNKAHAFLKYQIFKSGRKIYEHSSRDSHDFEVRSLVEYLDFLPVRQRLEEALVSHIKGHK